MQQKGSALCLNHISTSRQHSPMTWPTAYNNWVIGVTKEILIYTNWIMLPEFYCYFTYLFSLINFAIYETRNRDVFCSSEIWTSNIHRTWKWIVLIRQSILFEDLWTPQHLFAAFVDWKGKYIVTCPTRVKICQLIKIMISEHHSFPTGYAKFNPSTTSGPLIRVFSS